MQRTETACDAGVLGMIHSHDLDPQGLGRYLYNTAFIIDGSLSSILTIAAFKNVFRIDIAQSSVAMVYNGTKTCYPVLDASRRLLHTYLGWSYEDLAFEYCFTNEQMFCPNMPDTPVFSDSQSRRVDTFVETLLSNAEKIRQHRPKSSLISLAVLAPSLGLVSELQRRCNKKFLIFFNTGQRNDPELSQDIYKLVDTNKAIVVDCGADSVLRNVDFQMRNKLSGLTFLRPTCPEYISDFYENFRVLFPEGMNIVEHAVSTTNHYLLHPSSALEKFGVSDLHCLGATEFHTMCSLYRNNFGRYIERITSPEFSSYLLPGMFHYATHPNFFAMLDSMFVAWLMGLLAQKTTGKDIENVACLSYGSLDKFRCMKDGQMPVNWVKWSLIAKSYGPRSGAEWNMVHQFRDLIERTLQTPPPISMFVNCTETSPSCFSIAGNQSEHSIQVAFSILPSSLSSASPHRDRSPTPCEFVDTDG